MSDKINQTWTTRAPAVRRALKFIKSKGAITAPQLVEWDAGHGRQLFTWDDPLAASRYREHEARLFLNSFRAKFDGMRVRAFIHIDEDEAAGIDHAAYYSVETISHHAGMRAQVLAVLNRRMLSLASEHKMWHLSDEERDVLVEQLRAAMQ